MQVLVVLQQSIKQIIAHLLMQQQINLVVMVTAIKYNCKYPKYISSTNKTDLNYTMAAGAPAAKNTVVVNGLTLSQLKDGISRVQAFYAKYGRLQRYVSYGTRKIPIATFKKNIVTKGLKIKTTTSYSVANTDTSSVAALAKSLAAGSTSKYMTAVRIFNWCKYKLGYSFYYGTKYSAAGTLKHMTGNCCDTANLLLPWQDTRV